MLRTAKAGLYAFVEATEELYGGQPDFAQIATAGQTDCHIAAQIISLAAGRPAAEKEIAALLGRYLELLPVHLAARQGFVIPPVREILEYLNDRDDYHCLLLTGNCLVGARAKLEHYDIARFFDFAASAFGDDCHSRAEIAALALRNAKDRFPLIRPQDIVVIGDTPNDISCGKAIGALTVAVATGAYALADLAAHEPWWAVERLPGPLALAAKLAGG